MTSKQIRNQLTDARINRTLAGKAYETVSTAMTREEHDTLNDGSVTYDKLTPAQARFLLAIRAHNKELDRVQELEAEFAMTRACEAFEQFSADKFAPRA